MSQRFKGVTSITGIQGCHMQITALQCFTSSAYTERKMVSHKNCFQKLVFVCLFVRLFACLFVCLFPLVFGKTVATVSGTGEADVLDSVVLLLSLRETLIM